MGMALRSWSQSDLASIKDPKAPIRELEGHQRRFRRCLQRSASREIVVADFDKIPSRLAPWVLR